MTSPSKEVESLPELPLSIPDVQALIREAGGIVHSDGNIFFTNAERFIAAAVLCGEIAVARERERCAKLCETLNHGAFGAPSFMHGIQSGSIGCAAAIRGEGKP